MTIRPTYFATPAAFRRWLERCHDSETELLVGFHKKDSGIPSINWPESVEEALCFGWIDGVRKSIDSESYTIRFTPRRPRSIWSEVNVRIANKLIESGRMQTAGLKAFQARTDARSGIYSFEQRKNPQLPPELESEFRSNSDAWEFFQSQPAGYKKIAFWWVISAKLESTRARRLQALIQDSANCQRLAQLRPNRKG